jgi:hypothetical protein
VGDGSELRPPYPHFAKKKEDPPYPFGNSPINVEKKQTILPKNAQNHLNVRKIDIIHLKGTTNRAKYEGLFRAAGEKSVKQVAKVPF